MCYEYEWEYQLKRAEEARKEMQRIEEQRKKPKPASPASVPEKDVKQGEPALT
jgi:hypothetical protein